MNKKELSEAVAEKLGVTEKYAEEMVNTVLELITNGLVTGDKVSLTGFGTFEVRDRSARDGRNPKTGETISIPEKKVPAFKPSEKLKKLFE